MSTTIGTVAIPGANRTGVPLPTRPLRRPEDDIVARLERAHARPASSPFKADAPEFTREQLEAAGYAVAGTKGARRVNAEIATRRDNITRLYVDEKKAISQIAAELDISPKTIRNDLLALGVERDPTRRAQGRHLSFDIDKARELYLSGRTAADVARELGVHPDALTAAFRRRDIRRPKGAPRPKKANGTPRRFDRVALVAAYQEGASMRDVAAAHGCGEQTVRAALREAGVTARKSGGNTRHAHTIDAEKVRVMYVEQRYTCHDIAELLGHTHGGIRRALRRNGVELRDDRATRSGRPRQPMQQSVEQVAS